MDKTEIVCPKCGSNQLSANKKGFSTGNAIKGVAAGLVGVPGGILWGLKGKDKILITCLKCGKQFKPGEGKTITDTQTATSTQDSNKQLVTHFIIEESRKQNSELEIEQRNKEKKLERQIVTNEILNKKEGIESISIESAINRNISTASFKELEIFIAKINKEIGRVSQLNETAEFENEIFKMRGRLNEIHSEINAREKEAERLEEKRNETRKIKLKIIQEEEALKIKILKEEEALKSSQNELVKISSFHLFRSQTKREQQIKVQEEIIQVIQLEIVKLNETFNHND